MAATGSVSPVNHRRNVCECFPLSFLDLIPKKGKKGREGPGEEGEFVARTVSGAGKDGWRGEEGIWRNGIRQFEGGNFSVSLCTLGFLCEALPTSSSVSQASIQ